MFIPSHIEEVPKWLVYPNHFILSWLNPLDNIYYYYASKRSRNPQSWNNYGVLMDHMERQHNSNIPKVIYIPTLTDILNGFYPEISVKMYIKDLIAEIKRKNNG